MILDSSNKLEPSKLLVSRYLIPKTDIIQILCKDSTQPGLPRLPTCKCMEDVAQDVCHWQPRRPGVPVDAPRP